MFPTPTADTLPMGDPSGSEDRPETPPPPLEPVAPIAAPAPLYTFYYGNVAHPQPGGAGGGEGGGGIGGPFAGMEDVD